MLSGSVSCTNDVALVAFSECRNRTAYYAKRFYCLYERCSIFNAFSEYRHRTAYLSSLLSGFAIPINDVAFSMRLVNRDCITAYI